jgi:transposase
VARYGQAFKDRAVARLLPPESASIQVVSQELGVSVATLERWRANALSIPARERVWTAAARLQAVIATASMDETQRSTWCRENGVYPSELQQWKESATAALSEVPQERVTPQQRRDAKRRIKELERDLRRKDKALAETTALLVLSKKFEAILQRDEEE